MNYVLSSIQFPLSILGGWINIFLLIASLAENCFNVRRVRKLRLCFVSSVYGTTSLSSSNYISRLVCSLETQWKNGRIEVVLTENVETFSLVRSSIRRNIIKRGYVIWHGDFNIFFV